MKYKLDEPNLLDFFDQISDFLKNIPEFKKEARSGRKFVMVIDFKIEEGNIFYTNFKIGSPNDN